VYGDFFAHRKSDFVCVLIKSIELVDYIEISFIFVIDKFPLSFLKLTAGEALASLNVFKIETSFRLALALVGIFLSCSTISN